MLSITRYFRDNPIAARLLGLIILCSSAITLVAILFQLYTSYHDDVASLEKRLDQVRNSNLASITQSLWGFDQEQVDIQINSLLDVEDVIHVSVTWQDWDNTAQTRAASKGRYTAADIEKRPGRFLMRTYPLVYEDTSTPPQILGALIITASLDSIYAKLRERALHIALIQTAKTLLLSFFILWLVHTLLTRHMKTIARYARQLHLQNLNQPLSLRRMKIDPASDELDNVVDAINHMRESLLEDIEQRQNMELALHSEKQEKLETRRQQQAAEEANRAKSQFLATMSHEIRTPMNGVIGMLEMLRDTPLNEQQQHYVDIIHRSGESLLEIINDVLDYSKIEARKIHLETVSFNLERLLEDCLQLFSATASKQQVALLGAIAPRTPVHLIGDPTRLKQIIINLLGNAFKFTREGFVCLQVQPLHTSEGKLLLEFSVRDSGIGIDAANIDTIFESFHQADSSTTRKYGGTGLGLAICKSLAGMMGGSIRVSSTPGQGANFCFTIEPGIDSAADSPARQARCEAAMQDKTLLVVSEQAAVREFFQQQSALRRIHTLVAATPAGTAGQLADGNQTVNAMIIDQQLATDADLTRLIERWQEQHADTALLLLCDHDREPAIPGSWRNAMLLRQPLLFHHVEKSWCDLLLPDTVEPTRTPAATETIPLANRQVLVAEDNAVNRMVITGLLQKLNIEPLVVEDGAQALAAVRARPTPFDLILMDCEMPEMDGFEATRQIRLFEQACGRPPQTIIALTAHAMVEHRDAIFQCGMNDCLSKPLTLQALRTRLQQFG